MNDPARHAARRSAPPRPGAACLLAMALLLLPGAAPRPTPPGAASYAGELLVASPRIGDPRFQRTVILMVQHDASGAFGLILNHVVGRVKLAELFGRYGLRGPARAGEIALHYGGPVQPGLAFVLHTTETLPADRKVSGKIGVSPLEPVLKAMAEGKGPRRVVLALGYAGWGPGQLEEEMRRGSWYTAPADDDILFDEAQKTKWRRAMERRYRWL